MGYNDQTLYGLTPDQCMESCLTETAFTCLTAEYWFGPNNCYLSRETRFTVASNDWVDYADNTHYQWHIVRCREYDIQTLQASI